MAPSYPPTYGESVKNGVERGAWAGFGLGVLGVVASILWPFFFSDTIPVAEASIPKVAWQYLLPMIGCGIAGAAVMGGLGGVVAATQYKRIYGDEIPILQEEAKIQRAESLGAIKGMDAPVFVESKLAEEKTTPEKIVSPTPETAVVPTQEITTAIVVEQMISESSRTV